MRRLPLVFISVVLLAGCGSSSSSSSSSSSAGGLTHAQLVSQVNAICDQRNAALQKLPRSLTQTRTLAQVAALLLAEIRIQTPLLPRLNAIKPSAADRAVWTRTMSDNNQNFQLIKQAQAAAQSNNGRTVTQLFGRVQQLNQRIHNDAQQLGLAECLK